MMRLTMISTMPRQRCPLEEAHADSWTMEDKIALDFRLQHHYGGDTKKFAVAVADALAFDFMDAEIMNRSVRCCDTIRSVDLDTTRWKKEQLQRQIWECDVGHTLHMEG